MKNEHELDEVIVISGEVTDLDVAYKIIQINRSAKKRKINFDMSLSKVRSLLKTKKCYYTGVEMNHTHEDLHQLTFDRVDNEKGYTDDNVVACTRIINTRKNDLKVTEIEQLYKALKKHGDLK